MIGVTFTTEVVSIDNRTNPCLNLNVLKNLKICSQNTNSLNFSSLNNIRQNNYICRIKVNSQIKSGADLIFLQDIRVGTDLNNGGNLKTFKNLFLCNKRTNYKSFVNSTSTNSRGVAILVSDDMEYSIFHIYRSTCNNILILDLAINNFRLSICSIYGPLQAGNNSFFPDIKEKLTVIGNKSFLCLGDFNCVPTRLAKPSDNLFGECLDSINLANYPNTIHGRELAGWLSENFAVDLFRAFNPNFHEFSFTPFVRNDNNIVNNNRVCSRIDHVITSPDFIEITDNVSYLTNCSKFDHKLIVLKFKKHCPKTPSVDITLLDIEGLDDIVKFNIYGSICDYIELPDLMARKTDLTRINILSKELVWLGSSVYVNDLLVKKWIDDKSRQVNLLCGRFPSISDCYEFECPIGWDLFYEILMNNLTQCIISHQSFVMKIVNAEKIEITKKLIAIKNSHILSFPLKQELITLENDLKKIEDNETLRRISTSKYFEILNLEKGSKPFARLLNANSRFDPISQLTDDNNLPFASNVERDNFILNFYKRKYERPFEQTVSLNDFFGEHINHPLVNSHRLSDEQRASLEQPITLNELNKSMSSSNMKSAPGLDGVGMLLYKKFWEFLCIPILKGFNAMLLKGKLIDRMTYSRLKLITKGKNLNCAKISNLRSIANLSASDKIFGGIISNRLENVLDTIIHKSQKAYSKKYCIQESLLFNYELIQKTINSNSAGAVLSLDFKAAFDTVGHEYLLEALKFFNFGPFFVKLVKVYLSNRSAVVSTPEGFTKNFKINVSVLQGARPSPDLFKIGLNPLVLKIIASSAVSIPRTIPFNVPVGTPPPDPISAFADDANIFKSLNVDELRNISTLLGQFGSTSGLCINANKTKICFIGRTPPSVDYRRLCGDLGFNIVDEYKTLGITFDSRLERMGANWDRVILKLRKIANFWNIMYLTSPGKINIIKTFLLSQVLYVGSIIAPSQQNIEDIENIFVSFLNQHTVIAKQKNFAPLEEGGLGIPRIGTFLTSLDLLLFKKSLIINDTWCSELRYMALSNTEPFYFTKNFDINLNPVLHRIVKSMWLYQEKFWIDNRNILDLRIFDNKLFLNANNEKVTRAWFLIPTWTGFLNQQRIYNLRFSSFLDNNNRPLDLQGLREKTGILEITQFEFFRLNLLIRFNLNKYRQLLNFPQSHISTLFKNPTTKSKSFRAILEKGTFCVEKSNTTVKRYSWVNLPRINVDRERELIFQKTWTFSFLPINLRCFAFKLCNNRLLLNAHKAKFINNHSADCTFCVMSNRGGGEKERQRGIFSMIALLIGISLRHILICF
jgi:exonuclease III